MKQALREDRILGTLRQGLGEIFPDEHPDKNMTWIFFHSFKDNAHFSEIS